MTYSKTATFFYQKQIDCKHRFRRKLWFRLRSLIIKLLGDIPVKMRIHDKMMLLPLSHALPSYLDSFPLYDRLPRKISEFIHSRHGTIKCIDVGANIGDTIAAFRLGEEDQFLAIEPSNHFRKYLDANWGECENVTRLSVLCSSQSGNANYRIVEQNGTAQIQSADEGKELAQLTLDDIIAMTPSFKAANILKIDTDGFDLKIILGARNLIKESTPAVLFECDAFSNTNYVEDFLECMSLFRNSGYDSLLVYDNFGNFMGTFAICSPHFDNTFADLLKWQQSSKLIYFDMLLLPGDLANEFTKTRSA